MIHKSPEDRIKHFRRTLTEWGWMSQISENPDEVVRLLNIDARKLGELAYEYPDLASECLALMDNFKLLAEEVQERTERRRQQLVSGFKRSAAA